MQEGAGFITPGVKGDAPLLGQKQGAQAGAVPGGGQGAGVAVGEDAVSCLDQGQTVFRDGGAHGDVLLVNGPGRLAHGRLDGGDVGAGHGLGHRQHPVQHVAQIDRCGAGAVEVISVPAAGLQKGTILGFLTLQRQNVQGIPGEDADGGGAADPQGGDGFVEIFRLGEFQINRLVGEPALIQNTHRPPAVGEADVFRVGDSFQFHGCFTSFADVLL